MPRINDPTRRSVRLQATIRPPDHLRGTDLLDHVIDTLRAGGLGIDTSTMYELGDADPMGADVPAEAEETKFRQFELQQAWFAAFTHIAYLRTENSERADEIAEQVIEELGDKLAFGAEGIVGKVVRALKKIKELAED